jgi:hypothetical protein
MRYANLLSTQNGRLQRSREQERRRWRSGGDQDQPGIDRSCLIKIESLSYVVGSCNSRPSREQVETISYQIEKKSREL